MNDAVTVTYYDVRGTKWSVRLFGAAWKMDQGTKILHGFQRINGQDVRRSLDMHDIISIEGTVQS